MSLINFKKMDSKYYCNKCVANDSDVKKYPIIYLNLNGKRVGRICLVNNFFSYICPKCGKVYIKDENGEN
ncbi:MAG: hypothetical protein ACTSRG_03420 [Candidatus Helarchaeota archaeon]